MYHPVLWAAFGTGITCLSTVLGSATVLFVRGKTTPTLQRMFLGFAEGAAISLPLRQEGISTGRAFLYGALSGVVEPIFGISVVLAAGTITPFMPWLLSFAAGTMMYVVTEELIPEAHLGEHSNTGTMSVMFGFVVMMILDIALG